MLRLQREMKWQIKTWGVAPDYNILRLQRVCFNYGSYFARIIKIDS